TRDVVMEMVSIQGIRFCFADTAGVREAADRIESLGLTRTFETASGSDFAIIVLDGSDTLGADDRRVLEKAGCIPHLIPINKADLSQKIELQVPNDVPHVFVS